MKKTITKKDGKTIVNITYTKEEIEAAKARYEEEKAKKAAKK